MKIGVKHENWGKNMKATLLVTMSESKSYKFKLKQDNPAGLSIQSNRGFPRSGWYSVDSIFGTLWYLGLFCGTCSLQR